MSGTHLAVIRYAAPVVKSCRCGRTFTLAAWEDLPEVGTQPDGDGYVLVLRNCPCGSTLAIRTEAIQ